MAAKQKGVGLSLLISIGAIVVIFVSIFVLSGNFSSLVTTLMKPKATMAQPQLNQGYTDAFKTDNINTDKWTVVHSGPANVAVSQTSSNNLRMQIDAGQSDKNPSVGGLVFTKKFDDLADFRIVAVTYRPIVTGDTGSAVTAIRFASSDTENDEAVTVQWIVRKNTAKKINESLVNFTVRNAKGDPIYSKSESVQSNVAVLRLVRVNRRYRGGYQLGADSSNDAAMHWLTTDDIQGGKQMGQDGQIRLVTSNTGMKDEYHSVVGRIDTGIVQWQDTTITPTATTRETFTDTFSEDAIIKKFWTVKTNGNASVTTNKANNLSFVLTGGKGQDSGSLWRKTPFVPEGKDFSMNAYVYKPKTVGEGGVYAGILFAEPQYVPAGAAKIMWVVTADGKTNKLQFSLMGNDRNWHIQAEQAVDTKLKALTLNLHRTDGKYTAQYRFGDNDADWVKLGDSASLPFDAKGNMVLVAGNTKGKDTFAYGVVQVDQASGWVEK